MTSKRRKKNRRQRGSGTHGYGSKKKHRGAGSRGGRGNAGTFKHKYIKRMKEDPSHIGKKGFKRPVKAQTTVDTINVSELERFDEEELDLGELGYDKLLAKGSVHKPFKITVEECTDRARAKIEEAGGQVTVTGDEEPEPQEE